jgi:hypothetical protein
MGCWIPRLFALSLLIYRSDILWLGWLRSMARECSVLALKVKSNLSEKTAAC